MQCNRGIIVQRIKNYIVKWIFFAIKGRGGEQPSTVHGVKHRRPRLPAQHGPPAVLPAEQRPAQGQDSPADGPAQQQEDGLERGRGGGELRDDQSDAALGVESPAQHRVRRHEQQREAQAAEPQGQQEAPAQRVRSQQHRQQSQSYGRGPGSQQDAPHRRLLQRRQSAQHAPIDERRLRYR